MSIQVTIKCDGCDSSRTVDTTIIYEARKMLTLSSWTRGAGKQQDFCGRCTTRQDSAETVIGVHHE